MAKAKDTRKAATSVTTNSNDILCEPCHNDGKTEKAFGMCLNCTEHLCGPCFNSHRRFKASTHHLLVDVDPTCGGKTMKFDSKCESHPGKVAEYLCETCNILVCEVCMTFNHSRCKKVTHKTDVTKDTAKSEEFNELSKKVDKVAKRLKVHRDTIDYMTGTNSDMRKHAEEELKRQRKKLEEYFDELQKTTVKQIVDLENSNNAVTKTVSETLNSLETSYSLLKLDMELSKTSGTCELFVVMKKGKQSIEQIENQLDKLREERKLQRYAILPPRETTSFSPTEMFKVSTAKLEKQITIDTDKDTQAPGIKDLTIVKGQYCVISDTKNKSIKVIDTRNMSVTSIAITTEYVLGVSAVNEDHFAASVLKQGRWQVLFFCITDSGCIMRTSKRIDIGKSGFNEVVHGKNHIFVRQEEEVQILDTEGHFIKSTKFEKAGSIKFGLLHGIAESNDGNTVYITDGEQNTITSFTSDGTVKHVYRDKDLVNPWGITVDNEGYVYVCSYGTNCIHQLTGDLVKVQVIIEDFHGACITFSSSDNKLYLGSGKHVSVYSLNN